MPIALRASFLLLVIDKTGILEYNKKTLNYEVISDVTINPRRHTARRFADIQRGNERYQKAL